MVWGLIFIFGLIIGSFLNVVICRLKTNEDVTRTRSHCPHCGQILSWWELVPIVSFLFLRRRCWHCRKLLSWQYPLVELGTGILFIIFFWWLGGSLINWWLAGPKIFIWSIFELAYWFFMVSVLLVIFVYDLKHYLIPDSLIGLGSAAALFFSLAKVFYFGGDSLFLDFIPLELNAWQPFLGNLLAALGAGGFFGLIVLITRGRGMGRGDIKLAFLMGLILGWPKILVALFLAFLGGATLGLILVALGRKNLKSALPFGPFLVSGTILAVWLGSFISAWYQALLGF